MTRPTPLSCERERFGSEPTKTAPSFAVVRQTGYDTTGGPAKMVTLKPSAALVCWSSSCSRAGDRTTAPLAGSRTGVDGVDGAAWLAAGEAAASESTHAPAKR